MQLDELRREEALEPAHPFELVDLLAHPLLELAVPLRQLGLLRLDRVVVALDAQQRAHPGQQLGPVERLRDEVVRARLDRRALLEVLARRDHDERQEPRPLVGADAPADLEAVELGHDDVEQDEVDRIAREHARAPPRRSGASTTS